MQTKWPLAQWAEIRWWRRYLKNKPPAAYLDWKLKYWRRFLEETGVAIAPGARVLDAGCGPAGVFMALPDCQVDAVDPLLGRYRSLPHFREEDYPWARFHDAPLERFSPEGSYDLAFCLNALNHMRDVRQSAARLFEALKPGATLVLSIDAHKYGYMRKLFRLLPLDVLHPYQETLAGYEKLFLEAGFEEKRRLCYRKGRIFDYWVMVFVK
jgi:SAM-dependent methyltransferase